MNTMNVTLISCPFCGEVPQLPDGVGTQYEIECDCGMARSSVQIGYFMTIEERKTGWNSDTYSYDTVYVERAKVQAIKNWNSRVELDV